MERKAELEESELLLNKFSVKELEKRDLALSKLYIKEVRQGFLAGIMVTFVRGMKSQKEIEDETKTRKFSPGDIVGLY